MKTFYEVSYEYGESAYFKEHGHARDAVWECYLENGPNETDIQKKEAEWQLENCDFIEGIGYIYCLDFED